jgi:phosphoribosyl-AMP cyclohydrolase / phosphoribosyl-ATP pyrophosphohydrolase
MPADIQPPFTVDSITFDPETGLVPVIAQEAGSGRVLMLAHATRKAVQLTLTTGRGTYYSRSRGKLWVKGEASGHTQEVLAVTLDCDGDALLYTVNQTGSACHKGNGSCFQNPIVGQIPQHSFAGTVGEVHATIQDRIRHPQDGSYVSGLHAKGIDRVLKKIGEEAGEVIIAAKNASKSELQLEVADLLFHTLIAMTEVGVSLQDVADELQARQGKRREPAG